MPPLPYIDGRPTLQLQDIFKQKIPQDNVFPLNQNGCSFFFSARYALAAALHTLGFVDGDKLLIPSYNCGVEIDPLLHYRVEPVFYNVSKNLVADLDDLTRKIVSNVKGIMITHFLGFPQPVEQIKEICNERNLLLIEDCAHALLSNHNGRPLGSYGDVAFFSLLKTIPVPNGGLLVINNRHFSYSSTHKRPHIIATILATAELFRFTASNGSSPFITCLCKILDYGILISSRFLKLLVAAFRKFLSPTALYLVRADSFLFMQQLLTWHPSLISHKIIKNSHFSKIKAFRRRNFEYLLNYFQNGHRFLLPFRHLPPGVCPLFFPLILPTTEHRQRLYQHLKTRGVITHPWWDTFHPTVQWNAFPDAVYLKERLFGLPIHQNLTISHLDFLLQEFEQVCSTIGL